MTRSSIFSLTKNTFQNPKEEKQIANFTFAIQEGQFLATCSSSEISDGLQQCEQRDVVAVGYNARGNAIPKQR